jgi:undecaprenyl-diphosphatase
MLRWMLELDRALFNIINQGMSNPVTDRLMTLITNGEHWVLAIVLAVSIMLWKDRHRGAYILLGLVVVFALCDQSSAHWLKPLFERPRPCNVIAQTHLLIHCSGAFAFPSAHAANTMGSAIWLTWYYPHLRWVFFSASFLVSISRIFVGVHYPLDILGGWILGAFNAVIILLLVRWWTHRKAAGEPDED